MGHMELTTPLSNMQVELLNLFTRDLEKEDLIALKRLIVKYLAQKATRLADEVWNEKNWQESDMDTLLHNHQRTAYNSK
mgnify:FL=1|jgi:hypothetical protein